VYVTREEFRGSGAGSMPLVQKATAAAIPDGELNELIEMASRYFDLLCGVEPEYFEAAGATATARTFYGNGTNFLKLDRYVPGSLNATLTYPEGYTALDYVERDGYLVITDSTGVLSSRSLTYCNGWYCGVPIVVTAKWGFEATPADVKLAVIEMVANLWRELDPAHLKLVAPEHLPLREKWPPRVGEIARRYRVGAGVIV
jgi:hypothetical protein